MLNTGANIFQYFEMGRAIASVPSADTMSISFANGRVNLQILGMNNFFREYLTIMNANLTQYVWNTSIGDLHLADATSQKLHTL